MSERRKSRPLGPLQFGSLIADIVTRQAEDKGSNELPCATGAPGKRRPSATQRTAKPADRTVRGKSGGFLPWG